MSQRKSRISMVDNQIRPADVTNYALLSAFLNVPREIYVPNDQAALAYGEHEVAISSDRKMMTPRCLGRIVESVTPKATDEVLLIGAGLGYEAAIIGALTQTVIAVESDKKLAKKAEENLTSQGVDNAIVVEGKLQAGAPKSGPYDIVIFNGAVQEVPKAILDQLKPNGRLLTILEKDRVYAAYLMQMRNGHSASELLFHASAPILSKFTKKAEFEFM